MLKDRIQQAQRELAAYIEPGGERSCRDTLARVRRILAPAAGPHAINRAPLQEAVNRSLGVLARYAAGEMTPERACGALLGILDDRTLLNKMRAGAQR